MEVCLPTPFLIWTIFLKSLLNVLQQCFCFTFCFWIQGRRDLSPLTRMEPTPPALEGDALTTRPPGKPGSLAPRHSQKITRAQLWLGGSSDGV